jgi:hypothetical protein
MPSHPGALRAVKKVGEYMKPRLNVITLAVRDLEKSLAFYRDGLGLPTKGIVGTEQSETEWGKYGGRCRL